MGINMLKIIGLVLVSSAVSYGGILLSDEIRKGRGQRNAFLNLLYFIKTNIALGSLPLHDIFCRFEDKTLADIGFLKELRKPVPDALYRAFNDTTGLKITEREKSDYLAFAAQVGRTGSAESEETLCQRYIELLTKTGTAETEKEETRAKLCRRLAPVMGLFIAVILL